MNEAKAAGDQGGYVLVAVLVAVVLLPATLGGSNTIFNDGDVSWHIATGQWILDHRAIPRTDPFSFTWAGRPWVTFEWLAQVILAAAYRLAGYSGMAALVTAALMALHAIIFLNAARYVRPFVAVGALIAMDVVLVPMMLARPHVLAWPLIAFWTWLLLRAREKDEAPPLVAALLMILWANLHGSFAIGLIIAAAFGLEAVLASKDRMRSLRHWAIFGLACGAAVFVNANGVDGVLHPLRVANLQTLPLIQEWGPSSPAYTPYFFIVLAATLTLFVVKRPRLSAMRWLLLGGLLVLALLQMRHQAVLAIVAAMILPQGFAGAGVKVRFERRFAPMTACAAVLLIMARLFMPVELPENAANPWPLIAAVPHELHSQPVLNGYSMGGPLILSGIRPYIDGRSDMYGDDLLTGYSRITDGDPVALNRAIQRWNIRWAILPHTSTALVALLDRSPAWRRIYEDKVGAIYVRSYRFMKPSSSSRSSPSDIRPHSLAHGESAAAPGFK